MILIDSNILINLINGEETELSMVLRYQPNELFISVVSEWEVLAGARNKAEQNQLQKAIARFNRIDIDHRTSELAGILLKTYQLSQDLDIPDALIAATAIRNGLSLLTFNQKDFRFIQGLQLESTSND